MLREYQSEIQKLKQLLEQSGGASLGDFGRQQLNEILSLYLGFNSLIFPVPNEEILERERERVRVEYEQAPIFFLLLKSRSY